MKLASMTIAAVVLLALLLTNAHANNKQVGGLIIGGGTGAIVGQAIGRNTESTVIGATVGGVLGYAIGNELNRHHGSVNQHSQVIAHSPKYNKRPQPLFTDHYRHNHYKKNQYRVQPRYHHNRGNCRKIVTIQKRHHRTKRVVSTVCGNKHRNYNKKSKPHKYNDRHYR